MTAAEVTPKSHLIPPLLQLLQTGIFSVTALTPLWKRVEGEIFWPGMMQKLFNEF
jgi:hypothetical protein